MLIRKGCASQLSSARSVVDELSVAVLCSLVLALLDVGLVVSAVRVLQLVLASRPALDLNCQVHTGRRCQAERSCNLLEIKLVDVEYFSLFVTGVCL